MSDLFAAICDDAALFPPGDMPLPRAIPAHLEHQRSSHAPLVGPFVITAGALPQLAEVTASMGEPLDSAELQLSVTVPLKRVGVVPLAVSQVRNAELVALEVTLDSATAPADVVPALDQALDRVLVGRGDLTVYVEVPRDERRAPLLQALGGTRYLAKFRTGGVRASLYPDVNELAATIHETVAARVPFKATAGLHHALRNTDPCTGFEQHGFLNVLAATSAALDGDDQHQLAGLLAERDPEHLLPRVRTLNRDVRTAFRSFGTCSVAEPVHELVQLGLLDAVLLDDLLDDDLPKDLP